MFESLGDTWRGWGRSLALPGVESRDRQLFDLVVVLLAQALPLPRLLLRKADIVDVVLLTARIGTLAGTRTAYSRVDAAYWLSLLADIPATITIAAWNLSSRTTHLARPLLHLMAVVKRSDRKADADDGH